MTIKVFDAFDGADDTNISAHTPNTDVEGGGWTDSAANDVELDGLGALKFATNGNNCFIDIGATDQWCVTNFNAGGADNRITINLRRDSAVYASANSYTFNFRTNDTAAEYKIYKRISGSNTQLASINASDLSNSTTYSLEPEVSGSSLDFIIDGISELSVTDSSITTGDYAGLVHDKYTTTAARFYDFQISDTAPSVGGVIIPVFMNHYRNQGIS